MPVLHMLFESEFASELTLAFRALMLLLPAGVFTQLMVGEVASLFEGHRTRIA